MMEEAHRRPIAARSLRPTVALAAWLVRRGASANGISAAGMGAAVLAGALLAAIPSLPGGARALWLGAALLVQLRLLANLLDGMVAVGSGTDSPVGELYNEVPDRISDCAVLAGLGWACGQPALGWSAAVAAVLTAYVRAVGKGAGLPSDFAGPMAKQQRMAVVTAVGAWCGLAPLAWSGWVPGGALWLIAALSLLTAGRRLLHIAAALRA